MDGRAAIAGLQVTFLSPSLSRTAGGIYEIERSLAHALHGGNFATVAAFGLDNEHWASDAFQWPPVIAASFSVIGPPQFGYSPDLRREVLFGSHDIVHLHALWMYTSMVAYSWQKGTHRPLVVTPNGMLEPWALRNSQWRKRIAGLLYERRMLRSAAVLQANTEKEMRDIRQFGLAGPVAIIPNGVTLPERTARLGDGPRRLVFLGRLHPKKGVRELLGAWAQLAPGERRDWRLVIAGWDDGGCEAGLRRQAADLGLGASVEFAGPQFGAEKDELLATATAFILPSFSEGLPMAVLEAWSYGLPVVMTEHCNLPEGFASGAAVRVAPDAAAIAAGLRELMRMTDGELAAMGARGRSLVERQFAWPEIAARMAEVYRWVLGGGARPACVETT